MLLLFGFDKGLPTVRSSCQLSDQRQDEEEYFEKRQWTAAIPYIITCSNYILYRWYRCIIIHTSYAKAFVVCDGNEGYIIYLYSTNTTSTSISRSKVVINIKKTALNIIDQTLNDIFRFLLYWINRKLLSKILRKIEDKRNRL